MHNIRVKAHFIFELMIDFEQVSMALQYGLEQDFRLEHVAVCLKPRPRMRDGRELWVGLGGGRSKVEERLALRHLVTWGYVQCRAFWKQREFDIFIMRIWVIIWYNITKMWLLIEDLISK